MASPCCRVRRPGGKPLALLAWSTRPVRGREPGSRSVTPGPPPAPFPQEQSTPRAPSWRLSPPVGRRLCRWVRGLSEEMDGWFADACLGLSWGRRGWGTTRLSGGPGPVSPPLWGGAVLRTAGPFWASVSPLRSGQCPPAGLCGWQWAGRPKGCYSERGHVTVCPTPVWARLERPGRWTWPLRGWGAPAAPSLHSLTVCPSCMDLGGSAPRG